MNALQSLSAKQMALIACIAMLNAVSMDIYLPVMHEISLYFSASLSLTQATITFFMLALSVVLPIYGPLSDHFGRRIILFLGLTIYVLGTTVCLMSPTIHVLILGRTLQAAGSCVGTVTAFAMIRDLSHSAKERSARVALLSGLIAIAPVIAPVIGALLATKFTWHSNFVFVLGWGFLVGLLAYWYLPETRARQVLPFRVKNFITNYALVMRHKQGVRYILCQSIAFSVFFIFLANSPKLLIEDFGVSKLVYSFWFALNAMMLMLGASLVKMFSERLSETQLLRIGAYLILTVAVCFIFILDKYTMTVLTFMLPVLATCLGVALILPTATSLTLSYFPEHAGSASAMISFTRYGMGALVASLVVFFETKLYLAIAVTWVLASIIVLYLCPKEQQDA